MTEPEYRSIGDVLVLLHAEFPDITISKIRFLESKGLLNPERTPSGYRKFYARDIERLRWILRQQKENFLPLREIRSRLERREDGQIDSSEPRQLFPIKTTTAVAANGSSAASEQSAEAFSSRERGAGDVIDHGPRRGGAVATPPGDSEVRDFQGAPARVAPRGSGYDTDTRSIDPLAPDHASTGPGGSGAPGTGPGQSACEALGPDHERPVGSESTGRGFEGTPAPARSLPPSSFTADPRAGARGDSAPSHLFAHTAGGTGQPAGQPNFSLEARASDSESGPADTAGGERASRRGEPAARPAPEGAAGRAHQGPTDPGPTGPGPTSAGEPRAAGEDLVSRHLPFHPPDLPALELTAEELAEVADLSAEAIAELESYGLLSAKTVAGVRCYGGRAGEIALVAGRFQRFGIEARHLRVFRNAAEREADLFEQAVTPLLHQRNPQAREKAIGDLRELCDLGSKLLAALLADALRGLTGD